MPAEITETEWSEYRDLTMCSASSEAKPVPISPDCVALWKPFGAHCRVASNARRWPARFSLLGPKGDAERWGAPGGHV
jgi:hypothetical protein